MQFSFAQRTCHHAQGTAGSGWPQWPDDTDLLVSTDIAVWQLAVTRSTLHISRQLSNWRRTCQLVAHRPLDFYFFFVFLYSIMCGRLSWLSVHVKLSYHIVSIWQRLTVRCPSVVWQSTQRQLTSASARQCHTASFHHPTSPSSPSNGERNSVVCLFLMQQRLSHITINTINHRSFSNIVKPLNYLFIYYLVYFLFLGANKK